LPLKQLYAGSTYEVLAYARRDATCQVEAYLETLNPRERKRIAALLSWSGDRGPPRNQEKCRKLKRESFWEFKAGQQRIFWCYDPVQRRRIILLYGFTKKTNKTPNQALQAGRQAYRAMRNDLGTTEDGGKE
jgi:phage-related protein